MALGGFSLAQRIVMENGGSSEGIVSLILIIVGGFFWVVIGLFALQTVKYVIKNRTTNDQIRKKYDENEFDQGWRRNCAEACGKVEPMESV